MPYTCPGRGGKQVRKEKVSFKSLEEILKVADQNPEATAEAADVLAILHFARKESNSAVNAAEFGLQLIKYHDIKTAYIEELLRRRLKAAKPSAPIDPTEAMFRHAESLRSKKEFQESGTVYQRVFREHSESPWSHPSGYRVGTCLLELGKTKEALAWWMEQFVAPDPAGPFRGQALLDIADFQLERQLDVDAARQALSQMDVALAQGASHSTWLELRYPLYLRMGLLAYLKNDMPEAEAWFKKAIAFAPKENFILADGQDPAEVQLPPNRVERLLAACRSTEELTPASARAGDSKVSLLLVIGDLYHHGQEFKKSAEFFDRVLKPEQVLKPIANQTAHALYRRMQCHWDAFDMKQAVALGRRFMANHPKHDKAPDVLLHCGIALYTNLEQEQAAIQCFEEVRTQYQATEEGRIALWHLAMLHKWEKRPRQSLELFELFKKLYPKDSGIEWIDSVLPELRRAP